MSDSVLLSIDGAIGTITLNRPQVLNTLDDAMALGLRDYSAQLADDANVRCIIIRGAGEHFMAGGDVKHFHELVQLPPVQRREQVASVLQPVHAAIHNLRNAPKPVLASVKGACAGFGLSLMMACDLAVAANNTTFSLAYCNIGSSPDGGSTFTLPRMLGMKWAMEIALLGDRFGADKALAMGLINQISEDDKVHELADALARRLASGPSAALARTKQLLNSSLHNDLDQHLQLEAESFLLGVEGAEFAEGVSAFVERRPANFT